MESNKDEALKCLSIAQKHLNARNLPSARRFCQKSLNLFSTPEGTKLLDIIESEIDSSASSSSTSSESTGASSTGPSGGSTFTSSTETHPSASGARHRPGHGTSASASTSASDTKPSSSKSTNEPKKRDYTPEQAAVVKRIRSCKVTEYYEIMSLKRDCEEVEVKKAYRKVCVFLFPPFVSVFVEIEVFEEYRDVVTDLFRPYFCVVVVGSVITPRQERCSWCGRSI